MIKNYRNTHQNLSIDTFLVEEFVHIGSVATQLSCEP